jgi:hypothetical protein
VTTDPLQIVQRRSREPAGAHSRLSTKPVTRPWTGWPRAGVARRASAEGCDEERLSTGVPAELLMKTRATWSFTPGASSGSTSTLALSRGSASRSPPRGKPKPRRASATHFVRLRTKLTSNSPGEPPGTPTSRAGDTAAIDHIQRTRAPLIGRTRTPASRASPGLGHPEGLDSGAVVRGRSPRPADDRWRRRRWSSFSRQHRSASYSRRPDP